MNRRLESRLDDIEAEDDKAGELSAAQMWEASLTGEPPEGYTMADVEEAWRNGGLPVEDTR